MGLEFTYEMKGRYLSIVASGVFSIDDARRGFHRALEVIEGYQATRVLVDCRQITGSPSTMDYYDYGELVAEALTGPARKETSRNLKLAHVAQPPLLDERRLSETVAQNRGVMMKSVDNIEEALAWLES